jgi:glycosyltransferase involved in cell wall biosynthesis
VKLLQVTTIPETLEAFLLPFAERFREEGWTVGAMARSVTRNEACRAAFDRLHDVGWSRNPLAPTNLAAVRTVTEVVSAERYDLVHVHTPVAAFVTRFALRWRPRHPAVVYTAHGFHFHAAGNRVANAVFRSLEQLAGPWTDELVVINREDEEAARRHGIVPPRHLHFVPGIGIDLQGLERTTVAQERVDAVRGELGMRPTTALFLMVAEFTPNKRHLDALRAFALLTPSDADAPHLAFAGVGPTLTAVRRTAGDLGVADRVHFLGYRRDVPVLLRAATALVLTSGREGLPRSVMEAMASGTPVIATDVRGVRDLVGGGNGVMVPVGDVAAIRDAMGFVLSHRSAVRQMVALARTHIRSYDVRAVLDAYGAIYRASLSTNLDADSGAGSVEAGR